MSLRSRKSKSEHAQSSLNLADSMSQACSDERFTLRKRIGIGTGIAVLAGSMVGSGIFVSPVGVLAGANGSVGVSLILWTVCGIVSGLAALCYAELGTCIRESGGDIVYLHVAYGRPLSFVFVWTTVFVKFSSSNAAKAIVFGSYLAAPFYSGGCDTPENVIKFAGVALILVSTFVSYTSIKATAKVQIVFTIVKFAALLTIIIAGLTRLGMKDPVGINNFQNAFDSETLNGLSFSQIGLAFYQGLFSYEGWVLLNYIVEEIKDVGRTLPICIMCSVLLVTVFYVLVNIAYLSVLSPVEIMNSEAVAVTFGDRVFGTYSWVMSLSVCLSIIGSVNGAFISGGRLPYAAARRGLLPEIFSMIHVVHISPGPSLLLNSCMFIVMIIAGSFNVLINALSFTTWIFYGLAALGVLILRWRNPSIDRPYKVPLPIPVLVIIFSVYLVIAPLVDEPDLVYLYATLFMLSSAIVYFPFVYKELSMPGMKHVTIFCQKLFEVARPEFENYIL